MGEGRSGGRRGQASPCRALNPRNWEEEDRRARCPAAFALPCSGVAGGGSRVRGGFVLRLFSGACFHSPKAFEFGPLGLDPTAHGWGIHDIRVATDERRAAPPPAVLRRGSRLSGAPRSSTNHPEEDPSSHPVQLHANDQINSPCNSQACG